MATLPSRLEIPRLGSKGQSNYSNSLITRKVFFLTHFYNKKSGPCSVDKLSLAFNDFYILKIQVEYDRILSIKITYVSVNWAGSMRINMRPNSLEYSLKPGVVQG